jgi:signal transduction histidine kinase
VTADVDLDALLAALILAPRTFARNRFFTLFQNPEAAKIRRRASRIRGILRQLAGTPKPAAEIVGERVMTDGQVLLRYRVEELNYTRTAALSSLEAATLRYALHRSGIASLSHEERTAVESALSRLGETLGIGAELIERPSSTSPA